MNFYSTIVDFFQAGGLFMYPIVVVLAFGMAIALERYIFLTAAKTSNKRLWKKVMPAITGGNLEQAYDIADKSKSPLCLSHGHEPIRAVNALFCFPFNRLDGCGRALP